MKPALIAFLALALLCACQKDLEPSVNESDFGRQTETDTSFGGETDLVSTASETTSPLESAPAETDRGEGEVVFRTQYPVYDSSCTYVSTVIENHGEEPLEFGAEWSLQQLSEGEWRKVDFVDELAWIQPLYIVLPEGHRIDHCSLTVFQEPLAAGDYRIVKTISGKTYTAPFTIGDSPITAESPHGFVPLSQLPSDYSPEEAAADGVVVCGKDGTENAHKIEEFFRHANERDWRGQLRIARFTTEGDMILTDVIRSRPDRIDCVTDSTRDAYGTGAITTEYYSYFVCADGNICLSNHTEPTAGDAVRPLFAPESVTEPAANIVAGYYAYDETAAPFVDIPPAFSAWTPDGEVRATSSGGAELAFSTTEWGTVWHISGENPSEEMTITDLVWQDNHICMVEATLSDGSYYYEFVRVGREGIMDIEALSHTTSQHRYAFGSEGIVIPE